MINRITLNLKKASAERSVVALPWSLKTFEDLGKDQDSNERTLVAEPTSGYDCRSHIDIELQNFSQLSSPHF